MPKISVIIPTYNREQYISKAVDSVLAQTYKDYEIIVVDDGSTDNTKQFLSKYGDKIKYFFKKNGGESSARNYGVEKAIGEYIAFLDSDDLWKNELLELEVAFMEKKSLDLVYSKMAIQDQSGKILGHKPSRPQTDTFDWILKHIAHLPASTILVKKQCFEKAGRFDESLRVMADYDMWLRVSKYFKVGFLDKELAIYRRHPENITNNIYLFYEAKVQMSLKYLRDEEMRNKYKDVLIERIASNLYFLGKFYFHEKKYRQSQKYFSKALMTDFILGRFFINREDAILTRIAKMVKPYLALCYVFFLSLKSKEDAS